MTFIAELKRHNVIHVIALVGAPLGAILEYRLIVAVAYQYAAVYIKFVGTHKQYDAINANTVEIPS